MKTLTDDLAAVIHEWLPTIAKESEEAGRETVQTVVWLVGLASGLVTLLAVSSGIITSISSGHRRALIVALSVTITCGVLQRIMYQLAERYQRNFLLGLQGYLVGQIQKFDEVVEDKGVKLLIDPKAVLFLLGTEMDFKIDKLASTFVFNNPNQTSACGCGESVQLTPADPAAAEAH